MPQTSLCVVRPIRHAAPTLRFAEGELSTLGQVLPELGRNAQMIHPTKTLSNNVSIKAGNEIGLESFHS